ncbi:MAG: ADOP family duplicated permease [Acidobacteriota bacterium]|nr:ADOP family duplicated permease [Acidobacteriota bacterium]
MLSLLSQAWKSWKTAKAVAVLAILALAIGIGSATAIYTVVEAVLLKPLPYREGNRFVALYGALHSEPGKKSALPYDYLLEYAHRQHSFDVFGWFTPANFNLVFEHQPQHIDGLIVTPSLVDNLGVSPEIGRWFLDATRESGNTHLAVISHSLWKRLGGHADILGEPVVLDGQSYTITGVAPNWFRLPIVDVSGQRFESDVWIPVDPQTARQRSVSNYFYFAYGRLKPGTTFARAESDVKHIAAQLARENPENHGQDTAQLESLQQTITSEIRPTLLLLFVAAGLLLLITLANVSGLLVTRAVARARETAIRLALGAAQRQLILQYFSEGLLVALIGGIFGIFLSYVLVRVVVSLAADYIPRADDIAVDWTAPVFAIGVAVVASLLTALAPLWQALHIAPNDVMNAGVRASAGVRSRRLSQSLVVSEIALAFTLLAISALLISQLKNLNRVNPGFDPAGLRTFQLTASDPQYSDTAKLAAYQDRLTQALENIPGVRDVAFVSHLPLSGCCFVTELFPEGRTMASNAVHTASFQTANSNYFSAMRIPLKAGRTLTDHDTGEQPLLAVINQAAAMHFWGKPYPVGAYGHFNSPQGDRFQVVGVVGDVRNDNLEHPTFPEISLSSRHVRTNPMNFVVRSTLPDKTLFLEIRPAIRRVNPDQPVYDLRSMGEIAQSSLTLQRTTSLLTTFFACAALLLATLGVYGVVAYSVRQRRVEIGTRMAIGAVGKDLLRMVIGSGFKMAVGGILLGGLVAFIASSLLVKASVLHSVEPLPFIYSIAAIAAITLFASSYPAWRATQLSPMVAIRDEVETNWLRRVRTELSGLIARQNDEPDLVNTSTLTNFVEATRGAATFEIALQLALSALTEQLGAQSAALLEKVSDTHLRPVVSVPSSEGGAIAFELPANGFLMRRLQFYSLPIPISQSDLESWWRWAAEQKPEHSAEITALMEANARLAVALRTSKETLGLLLLGPPLNGKEYGRAAKHALRVSADQFALMLENARLTSRVVEQEKLRRDVALAVEVQKRLLPDTLPATGIGQVAAFTLPARSVGGDYYDFIRVGDHNVGIALADVAGKGVAAALIMSVVQASLRILSAEGNISLPELVARMNRFLHRSTGSNSYATFFYAQIDEQTNQLSYVNAGHNPPYLLRSGTAAAEVEELAAGGMVIGLFAQARYEEAKVDLRSGDVLIAFTDGVTEALNLGEEEFGEQRLKELLRRVAHLPVEQISQEITEELRIWIGAAPQHDDLTFIVLKVN